MEATGNQNRLAGGPPAMAVRFLTDQRLDFDRHVPLLKSYMVASSDRTSSAFLCKSLWQTGDLGAPWEYLNASFGDRRGTLASPAGQSVASTMMKRLDARDPADYIARLLACRASDNGVFGIKARFDDFKSALEDVPELLSILAPVNFVYVERRDKLAQAVSLTRTLLAGELAGEKDSPPPSRSTLRYNRNLISKCLGKLERQRLDWWRWFEANGIDPFVIYYEDAAVDITRVVRGLAEFLDVQSDLVPKIELPPFGQEHDTMTDEWSARFTREIESGINPYEIEAGEEENPTGAAQEFIAMGAPETVARPSRQRNRVTPDFRRLPHYGRVIFQNRELLQNARVLDLLCDGGLWSLAELDAGAAWVVGVDPRPERIAAGEQILAQYEVPESLCRLVNMEIMPALHDTEPDAFDVIIGRGILERLNLRLFFMRLAQLRPNHVIIDTPVTAGNGPLVRYAWREAQVEFPAEANDRYTLVATPNHDLIALLCDYFGFQWRIVDDQKAGSSDPTRGGDARGGPTQTYVFDRIR